MTKETTTGWEETIPELKVETWNDGCLLLEQDDGCGNIDRVAVHPLHLRFMAEKLGLVNTMTDAEARALQMVDKLTRRMGVLHERIKQVRDWMWQNSERGFDDCDINIEAWYSDATLDISNEFMAEIDEYRALLAPKAPPIPPFGATSRGDNNPPSVHQNKPSGLSVGNPGETQSVSGKACANPSGNASAKASVKPSAPDSGSLFGGDHG